MNYKDEDSYRLRVRKIGNLENITKIRNDNTALPWVTVIVAVYNQEKYIEECLESIVRQDYPKVKIIVGDDASTDKSPQIISSFYKKYPDIIVPMFNKENVGVAKNINQIMSNNCIKGGLINFFAGDDLMMPNRLATVVNYLLENPQLGGCYHDCDVFEDSSGKDLYRYSQRFTMVTGGIKEYLSGKMRFSINTFFFWTQFLPKEEHHDPELQGYADFDYIIRVINNMDFLLGDRPVGFLNDSYVKYRRHEKNLSNIRNSFTFWCEVKPLIKILQLRPDLKRICYEAYSERCFTYLILFLLAPFRMENFPFFHILKYIIKSPKGIFKAIFNGFKYLRSIT